jgi:hypothetical protein
MRPDNEEVAEMSRKIYDELTAKGIEVIWDDRPVSAGVMFADADLLGVPVRMIVSPKGLKGGTIEVSTRDKSMQERKPVEEAVDFVYNYVVDELAKLEHRAKPKPVTNYREKLTVLQYALEQYTHVDEGKDVPESVIEAFVERIVASPDGFEWFPRFEGEPDKPLFCQIEGKRKKSAKVMIAGEISPSEDCSGAGCYCQQVIA